MSTCLACGAQIIHVETVGGTRLPVDAKPDASGTIVIVTAAICRALKKGETWQGPRYTRHHATCAQK